MDVRFVVKEITYSTVEKFVEEESFEFIAYILDCQLHVETDLRVKCPGGGTREALVRQGDDKEGGTDVAKLEIEAGEREGSVR
ncbi:hypothetical protein QJS10_CPA09g01619 [Acorus calamus]|uniref:Uncharacterized protein n=1 Tax=Acorus calamus TaxID=4465 RepID=A0AAV9E4H2_ACOCL|nr:hypothetical protein QJS10_CPA09g01619 [Acorus calamus]